MVLRRQFLILISVLIFSGSCINRQKEEDCLNTPISDTLVANDTPEPVLTFGIPSDSFSLQTGHIKRNGFLSQILLEHGVTMQEIDQVLRNSASVFDVRKIRSGNSYTLFCDIDSVAKARYLVYEHDPTTCYIFSFNDSLNITPFKKEIRKIIRYSSGTIETSLWESMIGQGHASHLCHQNFRRSLHGLSIFSVFRKGDSYKVFYEELLYR